jgi:hypothetical protein
MISKIVFNHDLDKDMGNEEGGPLGRIFRYNLKIVC